MIKNVKRKSSKNGFTIAELLISMLVVMVVLTALAPIIGPKKARIPVLLKKHGLVECYWVYDESGKKPFVQENHFLQNKSEAKLNVPDGANYCEFEPPAGVTNFTVYVIGAGSGDEIKDDDLRSLNYDIQLRPKTDFLRVGTFQNDIDAAAGTDKEFAFLPDYIRKAIDDWSWMQSSLAVGNSNGKNLDDKDWDVETNRSGLPRLFMYAGNVTQPMTQGNPSIAHIECRTEGDCGAFKTRPSEFDYINMIVPTIGTYDPTYRWENIDEYRDKCAYISFQDGTNGERPLQMIGVGKPMDSKTSFTIQADDSTAYVASTGIRDVLNSSNSKGLSGLGSSGLLGSSNGNKLESEKASQLTPQEIAGVKLDVKLDKEDAIKYQCSSKDMDCSSSEAYQQELDAICNEYPYKQSCNKELEGIPFRSLNDGKEPAITVDYIVSLSPHYLDTTQQVGEKNRAGTVQVTTESVILTSTYTYPYGTFHYRTAGASGNEVVANYTKLNGKKYRLYPANNDNTKSLFVEVSNNDETGTEIEKTYLKVNGVDTNQQIKSLNVEQLARGDIPAIPRNNFSDIDNRNDMFKYIAAVKAFGSESVLGNCGSSEKSIACPGYGSPGYFPLINRSSLTNNILNKSLTLHTRGAGLYCSNPRNYAHSCATRAGMDFQTWNFTPLLDNTFQDPYEKIELIGEEYKINDTESDPCEQYQAEFHEVITGANGDLTIVCKTKGLSKPGNGAVIIVW